jgi:hypothetical protein
VYAMITNGFDIATTIAIVSQFVQKLGYEHWKLWNVSWGTSKVHVIIGSNL